MVFCGDCGEEAGSVACCKSVGSVGVQSGGGGGGVVDKGNPPTEVNESRQQSPPNPSAGVADLPVASDDADPDSDDEEVAADLKGQPVTTSNGPGTVIERYDGGGISAWFVALESGGERLVEEDELIIPPQHLHIPPVTPQPQVGTQPLAALPYSTQYSACDTFPVPGQTFYATAPFAIPLSSAGRIYDKRVAGGYPVPIKIQKKEPVLQQCEGVVQSWSGDKGFGFVKMGDGTPDVFVRKGILNGGELVIGQKVTIDADDVGHSSGRLVCSSISGPGVKMPTL